MLIPRPKDPVAELRKWGKELEIGKLKTKDVGALAEEEAEKEISERHSRILKERR